MALAISFISEEKNTYLVVFDGKPHINDIVDAIKDKMNKEGVMSIIDWHIGINYSLSHEDIKELTTQINKID